jgi:hypothetical protein
MNYITKIQDKTAKVKTVDNLQDKSPTLTSYIKTLQPTINGGTYVKVINNTSSTINLK